MALQIQIALSKINITFRLCTFDGTSFDVKLIVCHDGTPVHLDFYLVCDTAVNSLIWEMRGVWCFAAGEEGHIRGKNREKVFPKDGDVYFMLPRPADDLADRTWMDICRLRRRVWT